VGKALDALDSLTRRRFRPATVTFDHQRAGKVRDVRYGGAVTEVGLPEADGEVFRAWLPEVTAVTAGSEFGVEAYGDATSPTLG
jgi:hypothetical protein